MNISRSCLLFLSCFSFVITSCNVGKHIGNDARTDILAAVDFASAQVGISIYEPATGKYLYNFQGDKLFIPASNTKLLTCYAAMKNLGDSLVSFWYSDKGNGSILIEGNGDASFLHPDFKQQPSVRFLQQQSQILVTDANWKDNALGAGWAWDDFNSDYMAERSSLPVYGNVVQFRMLGGLHATPAYFQSQISKAAQDAKGNFSIRRELGTENFFIRPGASKFQSADIPFYTGNQATILQLLSDTLKRKVTASHEKIMHNTAAKMYSQPTDTLLSIMMHRSDNFFAEQTLLMISNEKLGQMNDSRIIDTLLKTDFSGLPQKPKWVDGSGLSRYNLVSPQDFIWILTQMKNEFKWERIQQILPTGGEGTLGSAYKKYAGRFYAKTGTLSNTVALSGYLVTNKGKQLIFSVLVNSHLTSAGNIRKGVEKFLTDVIEKN